MSHVACIVHACLHVCREEVRAGIERLKVFDISGSTFLAPGLEKVRVLMHHSTCIEVP